MKNDSNELAIRMYLTAIETDVQRSLLFHLIEQLHPDDHKKVKANYFDDYQSRAIDFLNRFSLEYPKAAATARMELADEIKALTNLYDLQNGV